MICSFLFRLLYQMSIMAKPGTGIQQQQQQKIKAKKKYQTKLNRVRVMKHCDNKQQQNNGAYT